ncbi:MULTISPECIES: DUF192 domain-containing protein [unclassified Janthinobacterium]|uniref:DUF192 domain-containing protein n=1 Tax=unclassified Janthinobacterium TaxID=2610881 RepID=UPI00161C27F7|nr:MULTISPECIES: DUF192 domain-containing protein [unclassified Janthinobacterium]MBB5606644.1 uncharacterized membrane protein (UPF0127 family) [Janthinobacterium sp. S3T4]MBB5612306.1 uncharacterized membrane protein (UPF0127 family) [Janthinobacterium sp. S3M3]
MTTAKSSTLHTASGAHRLTLRLADSFFARLRGLMLAGPLGSAQGLLITHCPSVHGAFMRYAIDVVYLDRDGVVTQCVALRPWRASISGISRNAEGKRYRRATHALELAAGAIAAMTIRPGDRLAHPRLQAVPAPSSRPPPPAPQGGSAMIEFTIVGPIITLLGLSVLQYGMLFFAKSQINYASFMAAREGATANASVDSVYAAYVRALVPLYGGGQTPAELAAALAKAAADIGPNGVGNVNIELLNPSKESFDDWNDAARQAALHTGSRRVIPNSGQADKDQKVGATSGQTIQDANLIKLRITQGYLPKVPMVKNLYTNYLTWLDPHTDAFHTKLLAAGRIPLVTQVTLHMQSDAIEPGAPVSSPGAGNGGTPVNPGDPPVTHDPPPDCNNLSCTNPPAPPSPPVCNPLTDPAHCIDPCAAMCCTPS